MKRHEEIRDIFMKMEMLERIVGQLYKRYANYFPNEYRFWIQLSQEEEEHARLVKDLGEKVKKANIAFREDRFKINAIQTTIQYVQRRIKEAIDQKVSEQDALNIAWDIENGLLEKDFFKTFTADQASLKDVLNRLIHDTEEHRDKIHNKRKQFSV